MRILYFTYSQFRDGVLTLKLMSQDHLQLLSGFLTLFPQFSISRNLLHDDASVEKKFCENILLPGQLLFLLFMQRAADAEVGLLNYQKIKSIFYKKGAKKVCCTKFPENLPCNYLASFLEISCNRLF